MIDWPTFLRQLQATEQEWKVGKVSYGRDDAVGWFPWPIPGYIALLADAVMASDGGNYLDVGCGPGTKVQLAEAMFDLEAAGFDISPDLITAAHKNGVNCCVADAFTFGGYADFSIVSVNRPSSKQDELEHLIMGQMKPGAVLIAINWLNDPGENGWALQAQEYGHPVVGVWVKPGRT